MTTPHRTLQEAAQMALDALLTGYHRGTHDAIAALREALEAPEPVARCILDNGDELGSMEWLVRPRSVRLESGSLLYAAPPAPAAPARVPLTDEQIDKILERERMRWATSPPTYEFAAAFARAIEAAHGIGGSK